jgi:hypothetical protein
MKLALQVRPSPSQMNHALWRLRFKWVLGCPEEDADLRAALGAPQGAADENG